jgi:hypothetical protein
MTPAGYLYKFVASRPGWLEAPAVADICSISGCISPCFADYIGHWKHNGYWLFDSPAVMEQIARQGEIDLSQATLFYYEVHEEEFDEPSGQWRIFAPEPSLVTAVQAPQNKECLGYDVATFWAGNAAECSPLSCNARATDLAVNAHCLFPSFEEAKNAVDTGAFANTEPGPYRIFAAYRVNL